MALRFHAQGPSLPVMTACATSTNAIGEAYRTIKHGYADAVIAGGAEATIVSLAVSGFTNCMALTQNPDPTCASVPFDKRRNGFVMGEGPALSFWKNMNTLWLAVRTFMPKFAAMAIPTMHTI